MTKKRNSKKELETNIISKRKLKGLFFLVSAFFVSIVIFLVRWQVFDHNKYQVLASQRYLQKEIPALRGDILARDLSVLAYSEPRFDIYVYKSASQGLVAAENAGRQTRTEFIAKVANVLSMDPATLQKQLDQKTDWVKIASGVTIDVKDKLTTIPTNKDARTYIDGIDYSDTSARIYPEQTLGSHVVGFLGQDELGKVIGRSGLEQYFDGVLKPQSGINFEETDTNHNIIAIGDNTLKDARKGSTIITTIDKNIQAKVEQHLKDAVSQYKARSGMVIIIDPRTGEILSLANYPDYNPGNYQSVTNASVFGDTAITTPYEIGSVGKIYTMSAAVDQGKVTPDTIVMNGHSGCEKIIENRVICTADKKPQGPLTATDAMVKSDNLALFATAKLLGDNVLSDYLVKFGMGSRTGVQLAGEDSGTIKPGSQWNEADLAAYSYGESYTQTSIQAIMGVGALANQGKLMQPLIVKQMIDSDNSSRIFQPRAVTQVITPHSADVMGQILYSVYKHNLAEPKYKSLAKYYIGMKSGTSQIPYTSLTPPIYKPGYSDEVNTTYVGYDASSKNSFVMLVNLFQPQTTPRLSYYNARLLWLDLFNDIKDDLGVPVVYTNNASTLAPVVN